MLEDARACEDQCLVADGKSLQLTMVGSVVLSVMACGRPAKISLTEVYYAPKLTRNIVSYGIIELKGYALGYKDGQRSIISLTTGDIIFDVAMHNNVLLLETRDVIVGPTEVGQAMTTIDDATER